MRGRLLRVPLTLLVLAGIAGCSTILGPEPVAPLEWKKAPELDPSRSVPCSAIPELPDAMDLSLLDPSSLSAGAVRMLMDHDVRTSSVRAVVSEACGRGTDPDGSEVPPASSSVL